MAKINHTVSQVNTLHFNGAGTAYPVKTAGGAYYIIYVEALTIDLVFRKSTDGKTWGAPTVIKTTASITNLSVWYDRWSNISAGLIHLAYTESDADDTFYRTIDTENSDSLSTETVIFAGGTTANGGALSICRARGGNVYCKTMIDAGAEGGFARLLNANVPNGAWAARTDSEALATTDQWILMPGFAADNQDMILIFWDASTDEIDRVLYDDSGDSWGLTNISTGMVDVAATATYPHFAATVDLANSQILVVAWNGVDTANQDLLGWTVTESAITAFTTTPVLNATDDCGLCAIAIDTDTQDWYVYYGGKAAGSDTWNTAVSFNYKVSTDDGATWGSETDLIISGSADGGERFPTVGALWACPRFDTRQITSLVVATSMLIASVDEPAASSGGGMRLAGPGGLAVGV